MVTETRIEVRYPDVDAMGIVHHAVYPIWYELARMDYFAKIGFPYVKAHEVGVNPAMVDLHLKFRRSVGYPSTVTVYTWCEAFGPKKLKLCYRTENEEGEVVNTAETFHIWTGPDNRSLRLPEVLPDMYDRLRADAGAERETL